MIRSKLPPHELLMSGLITSIQPLNNGHPTIMDKICGSKLSALEGFCRSTFSFSNERVLLIAEVLMRMVLVGVVMAVT